MLSFKNNIYVLCMYKLFLNNKFGGYFYEEPEHNKVEDESTSSENIESDNLTVGEKREHK